MSKVLYTTESATKNHERLIETAQKNIVNANDPNYIRQDAKLISDPQVGAKIESVDLIVNEMLLKTQYQKASEHSSLELESSYLQKIIDFFGTPKLYRDDTKEVSLTPNLSGALQAFFNSLNDLQISNNDSASMGNSINAVKNAAEKISGLAESLQKLRQEVDGQIAESVNELNQHLDSLRSLSDKLPLLKDNDAAYNDAKAKMINGIREVSEVIDIMYRYDEHGSLVLETGNSAPLIKDGIEYKVKFSRTDNLEKYLNRSFEFPALSNTADSEPQYRTDIVTSGTPEMIVHHLKGGKLQALFNLRDKLIPDIVGNLDQFTASLTTKVNDIYANAVPETGFQSITSTRTLKMNDKIYVNDGKFKIAFLDPETGKVITHDGQPLPMLEFDLRSFKRKKEYIKAKKIVDKINEKFSSSPYSNYKITAELVNAEGNIAGPNEEGYLRLRADNANFNFAIVDKGTNFNVDKTDFDNSERSGKLKGINQFFGFSKQLFTYATERFYDAESGANSAISLKVSDNIVNENRLDTAKTRVVSDTDYEIGKNNKDVLKDLLQLKSEKFEFAGTDETPKSTTTLLHFGNNVVLALNSKNSSVSGKLEVSKVELDSISEQIASQSGVNTDEELLNITRYERTYLSTLKVFQTFNEYWRQFLNQVN